MTERPPRLDAVVVSQGLAESRARAQSMILGGGVAIDGRVTTKPAAPVPPNARVSLVAPPMPYVSRGGLKLRHALDTFDLDVSGIVGIDVGASTGGFTDVLLQAGAQRIYAIDVGYGQLAWKLRNDSRVVVMERTNIRHVTSLPEPTDFAVIDTSFISLRTVLPPVGLLLCPAAHIVALVKPQFEAGKGQVGRKGVVRDVTIWQSVLDAVTSSAGELDWTLAGITPSPILGPAGNVEFLAHWFRGRPGTAVDTAAEIERALARAVCLQ